MIAVLLLALSAGARAEEPATSPGATDGDSAPTWVSPLPIATCKEPGLTLPAGTEQAIGAVVVIHAGSAIGSGVMVSADGYILTAGHVVQGATDITAVSRGGESMKATVIRSDHFQDVAILHVSGSGHACLPLATAKATLGEDLFAIGSPLGEGLEFTISKGVVSGTRSFKGYSFLQTDASINAGNSGGPLLDNKAHVAAIVSWKIAAPGFEGLGFGVPVLVISDRLGLQWGAKSEGNPESFVGTRGGAPKPAGGGARIIAAAPGAPTVAVKLPRVLKPTLIPRKYGTIGILGGIVGGAVTAGTYAYYKSDPQVDGTSWTALQVTNTVGWVMVGAGLGLTIAGRF